MPYQMGVQPAWIGPGLDTYGADWFDDGGYIVGVERLTGDFYSVVPGAAPVFLAPAAPLPELTGPMGPHGLAYDSDTRTFLLFGVAGVWFLEPESFSLVGFVMMDRFMDGAAGSIDDVPAQTPELLVTGSCTGTMYVTVVDATPGGRVVIGSSALRGRKTVGSGPCAGAQLDLRSPTPRYDLVANSYGIASTTVVGTPGMCGGAQLLQAMDVDTCLVTTVKPMQTAFFP